MTLAPTRDLDRRVLGGVCAGIASQYRYPINAVRAATVALSLATAGLGGLAYLALWRYLPPSMGGPDAPDAALDAASTASVAATLAPPPASTRGGLYGPVEGDLPLVREKMLSVASSVEFEFLRRMLEQALAGSGKMMRPAIALLGGRIGDDYRLDRLVPLAASVELLHTATLVHDDVIDESSDRRGNPTSQALFGNAAAVMLGDYMFAHAAHFIAQTDSTLVVRKFAETLMMMATGELKQDVTAFEYSEDVQRYLDRIGGKTASLFATAAEGGAIVGGATPEQREAMRQYGMRLGIAFQIVDDILDFTGDPEAMGKPVGSDLLAGTLTLPAILYMQQKPEDNPIKRAFDGIRRNANLERAIGEIRESGVLEESMATARRFAADARAALEPLPRGEVRDTLDGLVDYVLARQS
jgi:geranylgeranyl pyrophosphate synthase/phage shock protein PspC (stress-responsive transcriptional regulator)